MGAGRVFVKATLTAEPFYRRMGFAVVERTVHRTRGGMEIPSVATEMSLK